MIKYWKTALKENRTLSFLSIFDLDEPKLKLITLFLALLELLKNGAARLFEKENKLLIEGIE